MNVPQMARCNATASWPIPPQSLLPCFPFQPCSVLLLPPLPAQEAARRSISAAGLPAAIERQAAAAVEEADALILVVDGQVRVGSVLLWFVCSGGEVEEAGPLTLVVDGQVSFSCGVLLLFVLFTISAGGELQSWCAAAACCVHNRHWWKGGGGGCSDSNGGWLG